jgi:6-phosphofructokinase 1
VVDICLIPEVPFTIQKVINYTQQLIGSKGFVVICVAEGITSSKIDELLYALKESIPSGYIKYIEPSYLIRSIPTTNSDHLYCTQLAYAAVDAAKQGYSGVTVGSRRGETVLFNTCDVVSQIKKVSLHDHVWQSLDQPNLI